MASIIVFDVAAFRTAFPAFANVTTYPNATLQMYWDWAALQISPVDYGWLHGAARAHALNLLTAHLAQIATQIAAGNTPGIVTSATIDKITVALMAPPVKSEWKWWLMQTPYGQQLLALLQVKAAGGITIGGLPEGAAFRKAAGLFALRRG